MRTSRSSDPVRVTTPAVRMAPVSMRKLLMILLCVIMVFMIPTAAFGERETEDSVTDAFVPPAGQFSSVEELKNRRIGVMTGSCFDTVATEQFPDAQLLYFNNITDALTALESGKIDAYLYDEPVVMYTMSEDDDITYLPDNLTSYDYAYAFPKTARRTVPCAQPLRSCIIFLSGSQRNA